MSRKLSGPIPSRTEEDYRAESDHGALERAEEVRADPGRMKRVALHHRKKMGEMKRVGQQLGVPAAAEPKKRSKRAPALRGRSGR